MTSEAPVACRDPEGGSLCDHFQPVHHDGTKGTIQHGSIPEHRRTFTAGEFPDGLCSEGHDLALERWLFEAMAAAGCQRAEPVDD